MRGKLRDKRAKYDVFKRESLERKRPGKRETRIAILLDQELDGQDFDLEEEQIDENADNADEEQADRPLLRITKLTQR